MIVFDLQCGMGHIFEAWFGSSADYDVQSARGLITCPLCGAHEIVKAAMAPAIGAKSNSASAPVPMHGGPPSPGAKALLAKLAKAQAEMLAKSENVGAGFADAARAIHLGDAPERAIHGQTSFAEARNLIDEGVPVAPLPLPIAPSGAAH